MNSVLDLYGREKQITNVEQRESSYRENKNHKSGVIT